MNRRGFGPYSPCGPIETDTMKSWTGGHSQRQRYNTAKLKTNWKRKEFKITLSNKLKVLRELLEEETI
ncbi:hypothetical protein DPMN_142445 [Dreissena polymorpha]|uniref:Uncharacterized protein n=1 Tax=Dreissena polymorpha TaxID=45954 RepID=A0A9D4GEG6_DREPO|nr:hypothetical protein DPMN_142445 [Dreissena polymorpha]